MSLSLKQQFVEWVRRQDPRAEYDYANPWNCAFCRFLRDTGIARHPEVGPDSWSDGPYHSAPQRPMPDGLDDALNPPSIGRAIYTFGALLERLEG